MKMTEKEAKETIDELFKIESKLKKWRPRGIGIVMSKETHAALSAVNHPKRDFVLQGVLIERRGNLRF